MGKGRNAYAAGGNKGPPDKYNYYLTLTLFLSLALIYPHWKRISVSLYLLEGNIRFNSSPIYYVVGFGTVSVGITPSQVTKSMKHPAKMMLKKWQSFQLLTIAHFPLALRAYEAPQVGNRFVAFAVSRDLIPLVLRVLPLLQTDRKGGKGAFLFWPAPEAEAV